MKSIIRFERDAPTAGFAACFRAPQALETMRNNTSLERSKW